MDTSKQLSVEDGKDEIKKKTWIYWRWKKDDTTSLFNSFVQNVISVEGDNILELAPDKWGTRYPIRVLQSEIQWYQSNKQL